MTDLANYGQWMVVVQTHSAGDWQESDDAGYDNRFDDEETARQEIVWLRSLGEPWVSQVLDVQPVS